MWSGMVGPAVGCAGTEMTCREMFKLGLACCDITVGD